MCADINNTGVLDFYWPAVNNAEYYGVEFYINNTPSSFVRTSETGHQLSGLLEGDLVSGDVFASVNGQFINEVYHLSPQYYDVFNFHDINKQLSFSGISIDGFNAGFSLIDDISIVSGSYINENVIIDVGVVSPRDNSLINYFNQEPFFTGLKYRAIDSLSDSTIFTPVDSFAFTSQNPKNNRNFITQIVAEDFYGSGITGNIFLENEPISIQSISFSSSNSSTGYLNNFFVSYDNTAENIEYFFYDNNSFTGSPFLTGLESDPYNFSIELPLDTTGYLKLLPYDWFGSGHAYYDLNYFYSNITIDTTSGYNEFRLNSVEDSSLYGEVDILSFYSGNSNTGSSIYLSIDSGSGYSFNSNSFYTGELNNISGYTFNYFNHLEESLMQTGDNINSQPFFFNFKLERKGSSYIEDTEQIEYNAIVPYIQYSNLLINYQQGLSEFEFDTYPTFPYSGIEVLYSGINDSSYHVFSGVSFSTGLIEYYADVKLVNSTNYNLVYDTSTISGSGFLPSIDYAFGDFSQSDASIHFDIFKTRESVPVNYAKMYGKYVFSTAVNTGDNDFLDDDFLSILDFNDYENHFLFDFNLGINLVQAPPGLHTNRIYERTGIFPTGFGTGFLPGDSFTGHYESGNYFVYRFVPYNGFGSGYATDPAVYEFTRNANTESQQEEINDLDEKVSTLEGLAVSLHSDNVPIPSGDYFITVDYSIANFTSVPHVVGTLSTSDQNDPILGLILSGDPTTTSATFLLSDQVDSTGYKLKYLASEDII